MTNSGNSEIIDQLYGLVLPRPRCNSDTPSRELPRDGIYFFFELDETATWRNSVVGRIVRVGTHKVDGRFPKRIRQHYGNATDFGGNKNGSVFRKHLGGAQLRRDLPDDPRLSDWLTQGGPSYADVEAGVSHLIRDRFTFVWISISNAEVRKRMEGALIAVLAQYPLGLPSPEWLGRYAADPIIQRTGLWNIQHVDDIPLSSGGLDQLRSFITV